MDNNSSGVDPLLVRHMDQTVPKMNPVICNGLATSVMSECADYFDRVARCAAQGFPKGITYDGIRRVCPREALSVLTRPRNSKRTFEVARSDMFMLRVGFSFYGRAFKRYYFMIPFCEKGGILNLRGSRYHISPTMTDNLFGIEGKRIFVPITRSKIVIYRDPYYFVADGVQNSADIYWSRMHFTKKDKAGEGKYPTLVNYLLCQKGLTGMFRDYFKADVRAVEADDFNPEEYPAGEWVECRSLGIRPRIRTKDYRPCSTRILVRREHWNRRLASVMAAVYYILDNTSHLGFMATQYLEDPSVWRRALARFIWKECDERDAINRINEHLESITDYVDELVQRKLRLENIDVRDIFDLFHYVIMHFSEMTAKNDEAGTHGKVLSVVPQIMFQAVKMMFNLMFSLQKLGKLDNTEGHMNKVTRELDRSFKTQLLVNGLCHDHPEVTILETPSDALIYKVTGQITTGSHGGKNKASEMENPAHRLHPELITAHSFLMITKSSPSSRGRIQPFMQLDDKFRIVPNPELESLRQHIKELL